MPDYVRLNVEQFVSETDPFTEERYAQFARYLAPSAARVLDVGCNTGRGGAALKRVRPGIHLLGLDCVPDRLARLPAGLYAQSICSFTSAIDLPDASVDAIVAGEFIEHLEGSDVDPTLREFLRLLTSGGQVLLTTPNPNYIKNKITGASVLGDSHLSQHFPKELAARLRRLGFTKVRLRPTGKLTRHLGEWFPWLSAYGSYLAIAEKPGAS